MSEFIVTGKKSEKSRPLIDQLRKHIVSEGNDTVVIKGTDAFYEGAAENVNPKNTEALVNRLDEVMEAGVILMSEEAAKRFEENPDLNVFHYSIPMATEKQNFTGTITRREDKTYPDRETKQPVPYTKHMAHSASISELTGGKGIKPLRKEISTQYAAYLDK